MQNPSEENGMDWRRRFNPPLQFGKKAQTTLWLFAPLFFFDSLLQIPLSNNRRFCRELSIFTAQFQSDTTILATFRIKSRKIFYFAGKWRRCRSPPRKSELKPDLIQIFGGCTMPKFSLCKKSRNKFSYVFPARTLYQIRLEAESNGRAVRA